MLMMMMTAATVDPRVIVYAPTTASRRHVCELCSKKTIEDMWKSGMLELLDSAGEKHDFKWKSQVAHDC